MRKQEIADALRLANLTDLLVVAWVVLAILLGVLLGEQVHRLGQYSVSLNNSADALDETARGMNIIAGAPLIGGRVSPVVQDLHSTAASIHESATRTHDAASRLAYLLGIALAVLPTAPLLAFYVPHRAREISDRMALRRAVAANADKEFVERYLAHRALLEMSYSELQAHGLDPRLSLDAGSVRELARAERRRLGLGFEQQP